MTKITITTIIYTLLIAYSQAQTITGQLSNYPNQQISLLAFDGIDTRTITTTPTDAQGNFKLTFDQNDYNTAFLKSEDQKYYAIMLDNQDIKIKGNSIADAQSIQVLQGKTTQQYLRYQAIKQQHDQVINIWNYLAQVYTDDTIYNNNNNLLKQIKQEQNRLHTQDLNLLNNINNNSPLHQFITTSKLISNIKSAAQQPDLVPTTLAQLNNIDYTDQQLYTSGLYRELLESHLLFAQQTASNQTQSTNQVNAFINQIIKQLSTQEQKYNKTSEYLLDHLESRGLYDSSQYLAQQLLNNNNCDCIHTEFKQKLEKYNQITIGNTTPDIIFTNNTYLPKGLTANKLSDVPADYYLVVFAAGWCPHCVTALPQVASYYPNWKQKNVEVLLVSLDTNTNDFAQFAAPLPFISTTDFKKWEGKAVDDYLVRATPSYFLLDRNRTLINRPLSAQQADQYINNNL